MSTPPIKYQPELLSAVRPLALYFFEKWEIGRSRAAEVPLAMELSEVADFLTVVVSRNQVETGDISSPLAVLEKLIQSPNTARQFEERVDIAFQGYDDVAFELFELPQVRSLDSKLDEKFPYWLFFLSKHHLGLQCILLCFLPPFLTQEARARVFPERIGELLTRRWLPAMNNLCNFAGCSEQDVNRLTERALAYITNGKLPLAE